MEARGVEHNRSYLCYVVAYWKKSIRRAIPAVSSTAKISNKKIKRSWGLVSQEKCLVLSYQGPIRLGIAELKVSVLNTFLFLFPFGGKIQCLNHCKVLRYTDRPLLMVPAAEANSHFENVAGRNHYATTIRWRTIRVHLGTWVTMMRQYYVEVYRIA